VGRGLPPATIGSSLRVGASAYRLRVTKERLTTGSVGEDATAHHYRRRGYRVVVRNWRCSIGEIDLVLTRGDTLVFCEVKTRRGSRFGGGFEAVTARKRQKLRSLAQTFLVVHGVDPRAIRFDVASVVVGPGRPASTQVQVFHDAF
jgi:putative endonuclease